ncbi:hypothetical protein FRC07_000367 [Ceratobasidium sp. 392]|nr:hypothetical protein FRC07_000367 [Ceratobasidium sp. 392]
MPNTTTEKNHTVHHRVGDWLPKDHNVLEQHIEKRLKKIEEEGRAPEHLHPVIKEFQAFIENDPEMLDGFTNMFQEVPDKPPYNKEPNLQPQIRDYKTMLRAFDHIIRHAPEFEEDKVVGVPMNAILDWPMGTKAGLEIFKKPEVNIQFKKMFGVWAEYLSSPDSREVLTTESNGWFGPAAGKAIPNFVETFDCDPDAPYRGFSSWDDFFTRRFRPGVRPIASPDDNIVVNSACESSVYRIAHDAKITDTFWLKGEPYSLEHMLDHDELAPQFVGGTVYQAFLSSLNYHRWASPVNGTIAKTVLIPGTYYSESPVTGFENPEGPDPSGPHNSQGYLTSVATRGAIYIQADNPEIGLMVLLAVGMSEVSTCDITVSEGQKVKKGDELGMFHFGGSTYCLIFRPETKIEFDPTYAKPGSSILLNTAIATVL